MTKAIVVAAICGVLLAGHSDGRSRPANRGASGRFVAVLQHSGVKQSIGLFSTSTGSQIRRLAQFGLNLTNNGLAVTPDDTAVYFTLIPRHGNFLNLMRLDVATGHRRLIAHGQQPAIDDSGARLAFMTAEQDVEVRDLHTGRRRELNLGGVLGFEIDPLNSVLVWLADEQTLVMLPAEPAIALSTGPTSALGSSGRCRPTRKHWPIVFIHVPRAGGKLSARCRTVKATAADPAPQPAGAVVLAASPTDPSAVWIAAFDGPAGAIEQVAPTGPARSVARLGRDVLPEAIDRTSRHILYIDGRPSALWEATVSAGHLTDRRRLAARSGFEAVAW